MHVCRSIAAAGLVMAVSAGCGWGRSPARQDKAPATASAGQPAGEAVPPGSDPNAPGAGASASPGRTGTNPGQATPGGPVWGTQTLKGTVDRKGSCTTLLVGQQVWVLTGPSAAELPVGEFVSVSGNLTPVPRGCSTPDGVQAVEVTHVIGY